MRKKLVCSLVLLLSTVIIFSCEESKKGDDVDGTITVNSESSVSESITVDETSGVSETERKELDIKITDWNGYMKINFEIDGRESYVIRPHKPLKGNPWVWRTEFFGAFDTVDRALLEKGWFLAYHCVSDLYGNPESVEMMKEFYDAVTSSLSLNKKSALFGFSRGGLYAVNFALNYPDACGTLYLDAPVLDIRSWPGGLGVGRGEPSCWEQCKMVYRLDDSTALRFSDNPLDHVKALANTKIPVILVCGDSDVTVPFEENGKPFYEEMLSYSADIKLILKENCDHHPHSLSDPTRIVDFIESAMLLE